MLKWSGHDEAEVASHGTLAPTRLGMTVEEQWPAFKLVGFGFYYAWIWVSYNSSTLVFPTSAANVPPDTISMTYLASTLALALMLLVLACARKLAWRLVTSNVLLFAAAVVAGLATVGTYLSSGLGVEANPFLILSGIASGMGTSVVVLRFGAIYAKVPAREAVMYTAASFVFAGMVYFVVIGLPDPMGLALAALLPAMAVAATMVSPECAACEPEGHLPQSRPLRVFFVRLLVAVVVFSVVVGISRGFSATSSSVASLNEQGALIVFATAAVAAAMFLVVGLLRSQFDVSRLYYPITIAVAAAILVAPMAGEADFGSQFVTVGYNCFVLVIWCLLAYVAYSSHLSPLLVFGLGRGASALGTTLGWMGGLEIVRNQVVGSLSLQTISVAMAFALLAVSMLVLNDRLVGDALRPTTEGGRGSSGGAGAAVPGSAEMRAEGAAAPGEAERRTGAEGAENAGARGGVPSAEDAGNARGAGDLEDASGLEGASGLPGRGGAIGEENLPDDGDARALRRPGRYQARCNAVAERYGLSPRERDVFDLLVRGRSIDYIAQSLTISFNTAKSHIRHIYVKADVHSRQELLDLIDREAD